MLKRVGDEINPEGAVTTISKASFPRALSGRTGIQFTRTWKLEHCTHRNADARGNPDLCLCR